MTGQETLRGAVAAWIRKQVRELVVVATLGVVLILLMLALTPNEYGGAGSEAKGNALVLFRWFEKHELRPAHGELVKLQTLLDSAGDTTTAPALREHQHLTIEDYSVYHKANGEVLVIVNGSFLGGRPTWVFTRRSDGWTVEEPVYWYESLASVLSTE